MSQQELQKFADSLSARERKFVRNYLWTLERAKDASWKQEMAKRRRRVLAGKGISEDEYRQQLRGGSKRASAAAK